MVQEKVQSIERVGKKFAITKFFTDARKQARASNPIAPNQADYVQWVQYDTLTVAAGGNWPTNSKFFVTPIGGAKTKAQTNMDQVQRLPDPEWMNVVGITFQFASNNLKLDIDAFLAQAYMEFWVGNKVYVEGPFQYFPGAAGLTGVSTATAQQVYTNGLVMASNFFDLRLPGGLNLGGVATNGLIGVNILQGQQFKVEVNLPAGALALTAAAAVPNPGTGLSIVCALLGIKSRGVQ